MAEPLSLFTTGYVATRATTDSHALELNPYLCKTGTRAFGNFQPFVSLCGDVSTNSQGKLQAGPDLFVTGAVGHLAVQVGAGGGAAYDFDREQFRPKGVLVLSSVLPFQHTVQAGLLVQNLGFQELNPSLFFFVGGSLTDFVKAF